MSHKQCLFILLLVIILAGTTHAIDYSPSNQSSVFFRQASEDTKCLCCGAMRHGEENEGHCCTNFRPGVKAEGFCPIAEFLLIFYLYYSHYRY